MKKLIIWVSGGVILLALLAVGGAYWYHSKTTKKPSKPAPLTLAQLAKLQVSLPQVMANTSDGHLVQITMTLQAMNQKTNADIKSAQSQIQDLINTSIPNDPSSEFLSKQGIDTFKTSLLAQIRKLLPKGDSISGIDINSLIEQ